jgi:hypothetical protein
MMHDCPEKECMSKIKNKESMMISQTKNECDIDCSTSFGIVKIIQQLQNCFG